MKKIKIGYWGSPYIAALFLKTLISDNRFEVCFVVTQPDKARSARGRQVLPSAVKKIAQENNIPIFTPVSLKKEKHILLEEMKKTAIDFNVILSYGKIIPEDLFIHPPKQSINFHGSILPQLRGPSPIQTALMNGYKTTGWTLQLLAKKMDAGDILFTNEVPILWHDDSDSLFEKMIENLIFIGANLLEKYFYNKLDRHPQKEEDATFCYKFDSSLSLIDWNKNIFEIRNMARALSLKPGMYSFINGKKIKIFFDFKVPYDKLLVKHKQEAGTIFSIDRTHIWVVATDGILPISHLQLDGKKRLKISDFLNGYKIQLGQRFSDN